MQKMTAIQAPESVYEIFTTLTRNILIKGLQYIINRNQINDQNYKTI